VMAIGMTMMEETVFDPGTGRIANATFGDYLIPVHADVPDIDVVFVGQPDRFSPSGPRASARSEQWECPPPSPTRSTTPPAVHPVVAHHPGETAVTQAEHCYKQDLPKDRIPVSSR
jgi:hypothetical protein